MGGEGSSTNFKRKILQLVKKLTDEGKHKEASELFQIYFQTKFELCLKEVFFSFLSSNLI